MDFLLRPAAAAERDWLWETKRLCLCPSIEQTWGAWDEPGQYARFDANFVLAEFRVIIAGSAAIGYISTQADTETLHLFNIMIRPPFQNRGVGSAVLRHLQAEARTLGVPLRLRVLKVNPAYRLYQRMGFAVMGETATHFEMRWMAA